MPSQVAWSSFDAEQQRRTQLVMAALSTQGTVDELGLGVIRDLISDALHPGFSVLHTRAKYLLFIPREYRALHGTSTEAVVAEGRRREARLVNDLLRLYQGSGETGIIGRVSREETKRVASSVYWPLLRRLRILRRPGSTSDYCRDLAEHHAIATARTAFHSDDEPAATGSDWWMELPGAGDFTGFDLSYDEATFLRDRFVTTEERAPERRSVSSWLLDPRRTEWFTGVDAVWDHPRAGEFPTATAQAMWLGRDLDVVVHGARILYNYLCAGRRPDHGAARDAQISRYEDAMRSWTEEIARFWPDRERIELLDRWGKDALTARGNLVARSRWFLTMQFVSKWHAIVQSTDDLLRDSRARELLTHREATLKPGRGRLTHPDLLRGWSGDVGYLHFDYNWAVARRMLEDIHRGLGTPLIEAA